MLSAATASLARAQVTCAGSDAIVLDCNGNGTDDYCDIAAGTSADANTNGIPDDCDTTECSDLWAGFEPVPPFETGAFIDGIDFDGDGSAWSNPSDTWTIGNAGCPAGQGKALKGVSQSASGYTVTSEYFHTMDGELDCGAAIYKLTFDARSEAQLNPRIDWQMTIRDAEANADVILIHWASTQSNHPGVTTAQGGNGRGRILVKNPAGSPALINTGYALTANTCYTIEVILDNVANTVALSINGDERVTTTRLNSTSARMDYFSVQQVANGQASGGLNRLALDNFTLCSSGAALENWPDCDANCVDDAHDPDCNSNGTPDGCDTNPASLGWLSADGIQERGWHAMAYDSARSVTVLFGGLDVSTPNGETWEWNGSTWVLRATVGPRPSFGHAMAYDSARGVVVLFGGYDGNSYIGDTWEWDGTIWTLRANTGPTARDGHAMVYDTARGVTVLFGGGNTGQTWEWDGSIWMLRATSGPSPRSNHAMAYDIARGVTVLVGGGSFDPLYDTWEWDGDAWTLRAAFTDPPPRYHHTMAYDSGRGVTVLHGGESDRFTYDDTWEWDGNTWSLRTSGTPSARRMHAMVYDSVRRATVMFGGNFITSLNGDTWEWDGDLWSLRATRPSRRTSHAMAYDNVRGVTTLFGGYGNGYIGDTLEWNGSTWTLRATTGPSPRHGHAMAYDSARRVTVLFGGADGLPYDGETWEWDGSTWTLRSTNGPSGRVDHAMAYDSARGVTVLFGGLFFSGGVYYDSGETWEWDGTSWTLRANIGPSARYGHAMAYDSARGVTVLFGGSSLIPSAQFHDDTWERAGSGWTRSATSGPSPRDGHALAYDSARGVTVLFGGSYYDQNFNSYFYGDTWDWDGNWALRSSNGPGPRSSHAMAYDSARGAVVLFGGDYGYDEGIDSQTWLWNTPSSDCNANRVPDECERDCNFNSVPDECDILDGLSFDCLGDGTPDECQFTGVIDSNWIATTGSWNDSTNWCPLRVPNNVAGDLFSVLVGGPSSGVTLDISPTIEALEIASGATVEMSAASGAAVRTLAVSSPILNDGTLRARDGRRLLLDASDINQTADGVIAAIGGPGEASKVQINGRRVTGGVVRVSGDSAAVELLGGAVLEGVRIEENAETPTSRNSEISYPQISQIAQIPDKPNLRNQRNLRMNPIPHSALVGFAARTTSAGGDARTTSLLPTVVVPNQQSGILAGVIENLGRIDVDAQTNTTSLKPDAAGAVLIGSGVLVLRSPPGAPLAELGADSRTLTNSFGHRVEGAGTLIGIIANDGVIDANSNGDSLIVGESGRKTLGPSGVYRASAGGTLEIRKRINHPPDDPALGSLSADGGTVRLRHPKGDAIVVRCETAAASSNGVIELADASELQLNGDLAVSAGGVFAGTNGVGPISGLLAASSLSISDMDSAVRLTDSMRADISAALAISSIGGCRGGQRGCSPPVLYVSGLAELDGASLDCTGGLLQTGDNALVRVAGPVTLNAEGELRMDGESGVAVAGDLTMRDIGGCRANELAAFSGQLSAGIEPATQSDERGAGEDARTTITTHHSRLSTNSSAARGCSPPVLYIRAAAQLEAGGSLYLNNSVDVLVEATASVRLAGDFDNRSTSPYAFRWEAGPLSLIGAAQNVEAAGRDLGPNPAGLLDNFAIGTLTLAAGSTVNVVDAFDNQQDGLAACDEVLYVGTLVVEPGATLNTGACRVYYNTLVNHGLIPGLGTTVMGMGGADADNDGVPDESDICPGFNDFADCDGDGTPDGCDAEPDCNANGVPDVCEGAPPCARVVGAASWRTHGGGVGRDLIIVNPAGRVGTGGVTTEPRVGGIIELRITFDVAPGAPGTAPVIIEHRTCNDGGAFVPYAGAAVAGAVVQGNDLVVTFTPSLENARTYRFRVGSGVTAVPGQSVEVRSLAGDINGTGTVNGNDRSVVVGVWTSPGRYSAATDLNLDGRTDATDRAIVIGAWTGGANCAP